MIKAVGFFRDKPSVQKVWRVMWLGIASLLTPLLGMVNRWYRQIFDPVSVNTNNGVPMGLGGVILALVFSISAIVLGIKAYRQGNRTWVLWVGFIPALLVALFWLFMIAGEILFPH